jgi:HSP20 family protein
MAIVRWDPFGEMLTMQREMDRILSRMGMAEGGRGGQGRQETWMPKIDIKQSGNDMQVRAELPGIKPEDVDIEVTEGVLTLKGERRKEEQREDEGWLVRESSYGSFQRSIALPESVDPNSIQADFKDGVLELTVPKAFEQTQPRTTKVAIGGAQQGQMTEGGQTQKQAGEGEQQTGQQQESREHAKV